MLWTLCLFGAFGLFVFLVYFFLVRDRKPANPPCRTPIYPLGENFVVCEPRIALSAFSISDPTAAEGSNLSFTISRDTMMGSASVYYSTADNTATSASGDYTSVGSTVVNFNQGQLSQQVSITTLADWNNEANETLYVNLSNPSSGYTISDSQGVGTITPPTATVSLGTAIEVVEGSTATFQLTVSNGSNVDVR